MTTFVHVIVRNSFFGSGKWEGLIKLIGHEVLGRLTVWVNVHVTNRFKISLWVKLRGL